MRGRKPTAPALHLASARDKKAPPAPTGVRADPKAPREPRWTTLLGQTLMAKGAKAEWQRIVPELDKLGMIALLDSRLLADYCVCCAQLDQANREIAERGFGAQTERGEVKNPAVTAANQCRTQLKFYISELGLSPTSRMRLKLPEAGDDDDLGID